MPIEQPGSGVGPTLRRATVSEDILEQIKTFVRSRRYRRGSRLPSERELAEQLGVSRPSVREALRTLTLIGVLETRQGSGTHIASTSANVLTTPFEFLLLLEQPDLFELYEARELIEVYLAERAAERRTPDDLAAIEAALRDMEQRLDTPEAMTEPNVRFHEAIAAAAHSPVLERMINSLQEGIRACIEATRPVVQDHQALFDIHARIYNAIAQKNVAAARRAMTVHMAMAFDELQRLADTQA